MPYTIQTPAGTFQAATLRLAARILRAFGGIVTVGGIVVGAR